MPQPSNRSRAGLSRRRLFQTGGAIAAGLAAGPPAGISAPNPAAPNSEVYTRIGVRPFINCTATLTINGGSLTFPEVIEAMEQAAHFHVDLDELMERVSARLAELLRVDWAIVTAGAAAALTHATAACLVGTDPEKIQRLPNLEGLKDEVVIPRESRNVYDHAVRTLGVKIVEVSNREELQRAIGPHTAMIEVLGNHFGKADFDLKDVAPIARERGIPILVDAAADYLIVPNPYIALGADLVAYSGGKIIRGPQGAGLLVGRKDLVRAAWANSAPHHAFGRALKVTKEEIAGMLAAVEVWHGGRDIEADFREWKRWYAQIAARITKVQGVSTAEIPPVRGGPFPTLRVSWDMQKIAITAGEVGRKLLEGEPRIMTQAAGEGNSFLIRPVAMKPGDYQIVAERLFQVLSSAPAAKQPKPLEPPSANIAGVWDVDIEYEVGAARHKLFLTVNGNQVSGTHRGWAYEGDLNGRIVGNQVKLRSSLPADGNVLTYTFVGSVSGPGMAGDVQVGEYGRARWRATRHTTA
ncbi:MAG: aminotransferase class V-fold PLP-dependent enzyme [Bryobacteraceae bacterium]